MTGLQVKGSRRAGTAPTLSDVARAVGVSPMTVSRVINKDGAVRAETRERVMSAISALNYAPNSAARVLAGAARTRIALIYVNPSSAYLSEVLVGCLAEAGHSDVQLLLEQWSDCGAEAGARRLAASGIDGVILPAPMCDDAGIAALMRAAGVPTVALATGLPDAHDFAVAIDDAGAAADMTRYLIARGHRRIGFIAGDPGASSSARRRHGHVQALRDAGLPTEPALIAQGDFSYRSGLAAAELLLALATPPTAIFASNDDMAAAVVAAAHRRHLDVPRQLSVCGFDDTALATSISPELTTVRQPVAAMAQAAVEILASAARRRRSGQPAGGERRLFQHSLVERESVGAMLAT